MSKGTSTNQDRTKVGEGKKPTGLFKRVEDARKQSGVPMRNRATSDPRY